MLQVLISKLRQCFAPNWANALPQYDYFQFFHRNLKGTDLWNLEMKNSKSNIWEFFLYCENTFSNKAWDLRFCSTQKGISKQDDVHDYYNCFLSLKIQCADFQSVPQCWCGAWWISSISVHMHLRIAFMLVWLLNSKLLCSLFKVVFNWLLKHTWLQNI